jgi:hypothetical protein
LNKAVLGEQGEIGRGTQVSFPVWKPVVRYDPKGFTPQWGAATGGRTGIARQKSGNGFWALSCLAVRPKREAGSSRPNGLEGRQAREGRNRTGAVTPPWSGP